MGSPGCDVGPATVWSNGNPGEVLVDCDAGGTWTVHALTVAP